MRFGPRSQNTQEERDTRYSRKDKVTAIAGRRQEVGMRGRKVK